MVKTYLKERIGNPDLFVGRKKEMAHFQKWISNIKKERSKSTVLLARRKMGKSAILERLYNLTFEKNDSVIPFYYEVQEERLWRNEFAINFFFQFIYQYIAFKTRKPEYLLLCKNSSFKRLKLIVEQEELNYLLLYVEDLEEMYEKKRVGLWGAIRNLPHTLAASQNEFIVQMIDEFQFLNSYIYQDESCKDLIDDFSGGYLGLAESKIAPMLISGSWVGWLMDDLKRLLPTRFRHKFLPDLSEEEAVEMIFKYSQLNEVPVTDETAYVLAKLTEGSPFYISSVLCSDYEEKDLTTEEGAIETLRYETLADEGEIKRTWMEYILSAFARTNGDNTKKIILYLAKHRDREWTRKELMENTGLEYSDIELEKRLKALIKVDLIKQGATNFDYQGIPDNIFDKVFRGVYQKEIEEFDPQEITNEYQSLYKEFKTKYHRLQGKLNRHKGYYAEYWILQEFQYRAAQKDEHFRSITQNLPDDFHFCEYSRVWNYRATPMYSRELQIDLFAHAEKEEDYSVIGEVKNRESKKFDLQEVLEFEKKFAIVKEEEKLEKAIGFIYSRKGLTEEAEKRCKEQGIAYSNDVRWLGTIPEE